MQVIVMWLMWSVLCPISPVLHVCLQCVCHVDLLYPNIQGNFIWIKIEIYINPDDIINNNLILLIFVLP